MIKAAKTNAPFVEPMLLLRSETLPEGEEWIYELKLDGYRALAIKTGQRVQLAEKKNVYYADFPPELKDEMWRRFRLALEPLRHAGYPKATFLQTLSGADGCRARN